MLSVFCATATRMMFVGTILSYGALPGVAGSPHDSFQSYSQNIAQTDEVIDMLPIPDGVFVMGSSPTEPGHAVDDGPQHRVKVAPFWMSQCEITWGQYDVWGEKLDIARRQIFGQTPTELDQVADAVTRRTPPCTDMSFSTGKRKLPAICMTQHAARMHCKWLSART